MFLLILDFCFTFSRFYFFYYFTTWMLPVYDWCWVKDQKGQFGGEKGRVSQKKKVSVEKKWKIKSTAKNIKMVGEFSNALSGWYIRGACALKSIAPNEN